MHHPGCFQYFVVCSPCASGLLTLTWCGRADPIQLIVETGTHCAHRCVIKAWVGCLLVPPPPLPSAPQGRVQQTNCRTVSYNIALLAGYSTSIARWDSTFSTKSACIALNSSRGGGSPWHYQAAEASGMGPPPPPGAGPGGRGAPPRPWAAGGRPPCPPAGGEAGGGVAATAAGSARC